MGVRRMCNRPKCRSRFMSPLSLIIMAFLFAALALVKDAQPASAMSGRSSTPSPISSQRSQSIESSKATPSVSPSNQFAQQFRRYPHRVAMPTQTSSTSTTLSTVGAAWTSLGPTPIADEKCCDTSPSSDYGRASGRVTSLVTDPTTSATVYAGSAGGGVWKSINSGSTWSALTDTQASLAIGALAIDASGKVLFAGTGEDNDCIDCQPGVGPND